MATATIGKSVPIPGHNIVFKSVPVGKYALRRLEKVDGKTVECEWHFFEVTRPKSGKWEGWTFLRELRGDNALKVDKQTFTGVLSAIANDPKHFAAQFGKRTGVCGVCGKTLTDPKSVKKGIGPICEKSF